MNEGKNTSHVGNSKYKSPEILSREHILWVIARSYSKEAIVLEFNEQGE